MENCRVPRNFACYLFSCLSFVGLLDSASGNNMTGDNGRDVCQEKPNQLNASYAGFLVAVVIVTVAGNGVVVVVITMSRALRNQTTNLFLRSLAFTDILIGSVSLPIKIKQSLQNQYFCMPEVLCWFFFFADTTLSIGSVTHLLIITVDRFIAIRFTYGYEKIMSKRRVYIVITCTWIYSFVWSCLNIFNWADPTKYGVEWRQSPVPTCLTQNTIYFTTLYVALFLVPIIVMVLLQGYIFRQVVRHIRAITICEIINTTAQRTNRRRQREMKAIRAIIVVFVAFCLCWIPAVGVALSGFWDLHFWMDLYARDKRAFDAIFVICVQVLPPLNSTLNPFIYVVFNDQFRMAFRGLVHRLCGKESAFTNVDRRMTFFSEKPIALRRSSIAEGVDNLKFNEDQSSVASDQSRRRSEKLTQNHQKRFGSAKAEARNLASLQSATDGRLHEGSGHESKTTQL